MCRGDDHLETHAEIGQGARRLVPRRPVGLRTEHNPHQHPHQRLVHDTLALSRTIPGTAAPMSVRNCIPSKLIVDSPPYACARASSSVGPVPTTFSTRPPAVKSCPPRAAA